MLTIFPLYALRSLFGLYFRFFNTEEHGPFFRERIWTTQKGRGAAQGVHSSFKVFFMFKASRGIWFLLNIRFVLLRTSGLIEASRRREFGQERTEKRVSESNTSSVPQIKFVVVTWTRNRVRYLRRQGS